MKFESVNFFKAIGGGLGCSRWTSLQGRDMITQAAVQEKHTNLQNGLFFIEGHIKTGFTHIKTMLEVYMETYCIRLPDLNYCEIMESVMEVWKIVSL